MPTPRPTPAASGTPPAASGAHAKARMELDALRAVLGSEPDAPPAPATSPASAPRRTDPTAPPTPLIP